VIDAQNGQPLPNIQVVRRTQAGTRSTHSYVSTNAEGEFRFTDLSPGSYTVSILNDGGAEFFSAALPFEVSNQDITGLEIQAQRGRSISGVFTIEGTNDPAIVGDLSRFKIAAYDQDRKTYTNGQVQANGQFRIVGLPPGTFSLSFSFYIPGISSNSFRLQRFEHQGEILKNHAITINSDEDVTGVRAVITYSPNVIRGRVQIIGGTLPAGAILRVNAAYQVAPNVRQLFLADVDAGGNFIIEGLMAGEYEVSVVLRPPPGTTNSSPPPRAQQQVTLVNGVVAVVTLTLQLDGREHSQ
jgi:hypothetical protein